MYDSRYFIWNYHILGDINLPILSFFVSIDFFVTEEELFLVIGKLLFKHVSYKKALVSLYNSWLELLQEREINHSDSSGIHAWILQQSYCVQRLPLPYGHH